MEPTLTEYIVVSFVIEGSVLTEEIPVTDVPIDLPATIKRLAADYNVSELRVDRKFVLTEVQPVTSE